MSMRSYAIRRILYIFPTIIGISIFSFLLISLSPGDPIQIRMGLFKGEQSEYDDMYYQIGADLGLIEYREVNGVIEQHNVSVVVRYLRWLGLMKRPIEGE
ncbi:MAG: hypothetical protein ACFFDW_11620 [Candidatus Thorarchaeota archaeon]